MRGTARHVACRVTQPRKKSPAQCLAHLGTRGSKKALEITGLGVEARRSTARNQTLKVCTSYNQKKKKKKTSKTSILKSQNPILRTPRDGDGDYIAAMRGGEANQDPRRG